MTLPEVQLEARMIAVRDIVEHEANPREQFDSDALHELAASMLQVGLIEPLVLERAAVGFRLLAGARRLRAARLIRLTRVPAIIRPSAGSPAKTVALMLMENGHRKGLNPIEEARGYARMMGLDTHLTQAHVARLVGKSTTHVNQRLMLLNLTHEEQEQVIHGELQVQVARETARERAGTATQTRYTGFHFGKAHPLAARVRDCCRQAGHSNARQVGGMGCGECWEAVIRSDERASVLVEQQLVDFHPDETPAGPEQASA